ncbi:MAG: Gfo/Idh/MocA family oxidoreductase [Planctomycetes bacterium]|nr:Gfo/Idh/MocA family oxidoreductase [Planctomycetota bacterium]
MIRLALIGFGGYGWSFAQLIPQVAERAGCRLVAAADTRLAALPEKAQELAKAGVELFDDPLAMLDALRGRCEAVYVATGIPSHTPLTIAAAQAGYHVHLEKPPAATVQEVDAMLAALDAAGRFCLVGFQALHGADICFVKDRVVSGRLGRVKSLVCHAGWPRSRSYYMRNDWAGKLRVEDAGQGRPAHRDSAGRGGPAHRDSAGQGRPAYRDSAGRGGPAHRDSAGRGGPAHRDSAGRGGPAHGAWVLDGPATNALAHQITNMLFLASPEPGRLATPTAVRAELYAAGEVESHDTCAIEIQTAEGPTCLFLASHCTEANFGPAIELEAENGHVHWTMRDGARIGYADGRQDACPTSDGRPEMVGNLVEAVRANDPALLRCPLVETRKFVLALDGAHESSGCIHRIAPEHTRQVGEGGDARTVVVGLDTLLAQAAQAKCLFSDLAQAPGWAGGTGVFDLAGYPTFPTRFANP